MKKLKQFGTKTLAQANLQYILKNPHLTAIIPGMITCEEIVANASVSGSRMMGMNDTDALDRHARAVRHSLPAQYRWLNNWNA